MSPLAEFLRMGGYAFHVWTAYGAVLLVLALNLAAPIVRRRRFARERAGGASPPGSANPARDASPARPTPARTAGPAR